MSDIAKKRKGGLRQRIAEERSERQRTSAIATYLLKQYSWGKMSVQQVQEVASLVLQDMNEFQSDIIFPQLVSLARFGSSGQHPNNMSRDMTRFIEAIPKLPPSSEIPMPTQKGEERTGLLLPHEIFSHMYENNRSAFNKLFIPDGPSSLKKFWNQCRGAACLQNQPVLVNLNPSKCIPIGIHGDEVPIAGRGKCWVKMALVFTWFSLVANQMPTKESLLWIWAGSPQHFLSGENGTMNTFYMILAWSMDCLFSGLWPTRDHRGVAYHPGSKEYRKANSQLAGGFYCTLVGLCGDLDYFAKFLSMPHWGSHNPCGWCGCTKLGPRTWKDSRETAPWRATIHTTSTWLENPERSQCPIFHCKNTTGLTVQPDLMHVKYLGYQQFFLGSCLWLLCHEILPGSPVQNIRSIGLFVFRYQQRERVSSKFPLGAFQKLSIFTRKKGFPKLRGKGAHVRQVSKAIGACWRRNMSQDDPNHRRVALIFKLDQEVEDLLSGHQPSDGYYALPPNEANAVKRKHNQISQLYQVLEDNYANAAVPLFNVVSKIHYCHHIYSESCNLHPYLSWCWRGEDFMSVASDLLSSCLRGRSDVGASIKAVQKYRLAMHLCFKDLEA